MIDVDFERRLRTAARAAADGVAVPPVPGPLRQLGAVRAPRRAPGWWWAAAASVALGLIGATDAGRAALAGVVEHTVDVFNFDPDTGKRNTVSTVSLRDALSTRAFRVIEPRGLPVDARLVSIRRLGDPETGRPTLLFQYTLGGRPFEILESGITKPGSTANQAVRSSSLTLPEQKHVTMRIVTPSLITFRARRTLVTVTSGAGALSNAQMDAVREAVTRF